MLGLAFYYEDPSKNIYSNRTAGDVEIWRGCARCWGCTHFFMIDITPDGAGISAYEHHDVATLYGRHRTLEELEALYPHAKFVYTGAEIDLARSGIEGTPYHEFDHPTGDVIYVFGPDSGAVNIRTGRKDRPWVYVPCRGDAWAICAAGAIMADRYTKLG